MNYPHEWMIMKMSHAFLMLTWHNLQLVCYNLCIVCMCALFSLFLIHQSLKNTNQNPNTTHPRTPQHLSGGRSKVIDHKITILINISPWTQFYWNRELDRRFNHSDSWCPAALQNALAKHTHTHTPNGRKKIKQQCCATAGTKDTIIIMQWK